MYGLRKNAHNIFRNVIFTLPKSKRRRETKHVENS